MTSVPPVLKKKKATAQPTVVRLLPGTVMAV